MIDNEYTYIHKYESTGYYDDKKFFNESDFETIEKYEAFKKFIPRLDFINITGIFVTPQQYYCIFNTFYDMDITQEEFVKDYEKKYSGYIVYTNDGLKYDFDDEEISNNGWFDPEDPMGVLQNLNSMDLINNAVLEIYHWKARYNEMHDLVVQLNNILEKRELL